MHRRSQVSVRRLHGARRRLLLGRCFGGQRLLRQRQSLRGRESCHVQVPCRARRCAHLIAQHTLPWTAPLPAVYSSPILIQNSRPLYLSFACSHAAKLIYRVHGCCLLPPSLLSALASSQPTARGTAPSLPPCLTNAWRIGGVARITSTTPSGPSSPSRTSNRNAKTAPKEPARAGRRFAPVLSSAGARTTVCCAGARNPAPHASSVRRGAPMARRASLPTVTRSATLTRRRRHQTRTQHVRTRASTSQTMANVMTAGWGPSTVTASWAPTAPTAAAVHRRPRSWKFRLRRRPPSRLRRRRCRLPQLPSSQPASVSAWACQRAT